MSIVPFLQIPQHLGHFEGGALGSSGMVVIVEVVVVKLGVLELVVKVVVVLELVEAVAATVEGSGTLGLGQVTSFTSGGQKSLIFWYRYHWRVGESPVGVRRSGRMVADGVHSSLSRLKSTSGVSDFTHAKTCPLSLDEKRR